jgi:hypothetical protein
MSDKQAMIKTMLEMQSMFMKYEHENGVTAEDYYAAPESHPLFHYREKYLELADKVCNMAHADKGSIRD